MSADKLISSSSLPRQAKGKKSRSQSCSRSIFRTKACFSRPFISKPFWCSKQKEGLSLNEDVFMCCSTKKKKKKILYRQKRKMRKATLLRKLSVLSLYSLFIPPHKKEALLFVLLTAFPAEEKKWFAHFFTYGTHKVIMRHWHDMTKQEMLGIINVLSKHGVWKSQIKSYSTLRAKRATFTFWVDKS